MISLLMNIQTRSNMIAKNLLMLMMMTKTLHAFHTSDVIRYLSLSKNLGTKITFRTHNKELVLEHTIKSLCCFLMINLTLFSVKIFLMY